MDTGERIISKILIGDPEAEIGADGVLTPFRNCTIICENGSMHTIKALAFTATKESLSALWEADKSKFTKSAITVK